VDRSHGLLKSHLQCPICHHESTIFDPYSSLSLPLPVKRQRKVELLYFPSAPESPPLHMKALVPANATLSHLQEWIRSKQAVQSSSSLSFAEVTESKWKISLEESEPVSDLRLPPAYSRRTPLPTTCVYEVPQPPQTPDEEKEEQEEAPEGKKSSSWNPFKSKGKSVTETEYTVHITRSVSSGYNRRTEFLFAPQRLQLSGKTNMEVYEDCIKIASKYFEEEEKAKLLGWFEGMKARSEAEEEEESDEPDLLTVSWVVKGSFSTTKEALPLDNELALDSKSKGESLVIKFKSDLIESARYFSDVVVQHDSLQDSDEEDEQDRVIPLKDCFEEFLRSEQLNSDNKWYCSRCKDHVCASKKFDLWAAPDVLILHLKRFEYLTMRRMVKRQKLTNIVDFPLEGLDISEFLIGPGKADDPLREEGDLSTVYDLYAVSEHSGGLGGGHYTAVARSLDVNEETGEVNYGDWRSYNDSHVSRARVESIVSSRAYVLFYQRRGKPLKWGGIQPGPKETE